MGELTFSSTESWGDFAKVPWMFMIKIIFLPQYLPFFHRPLAVRHRWINNAFCTLCEFMDKAPWCLCQDVLGKVLHFGHWNVKWGEISSGTAPLSTRDHSLSEMKLVQYRSDPFLHASLLLEFWNFTAFSKCQLWETYKARNVYQSLLVVSGFLALSLSAESWQCCQGSHWNPLPQWLPLLIQCRVCPACPIETCLGTSQPL